MLLITNYLTVWPVRTPPREQAQFPAQSQDRLGFSPDIYLLLVKMIPLGSEVRLGPLALHPGVNAVHPSSCTRRLHRGDIFLLLLFSNKNKVQRSWARRGSWSCLQLSSSGTSLNLITAGASRLKEKGKAATAGVTSRGRIRPHEVRGSINHLYIHLHAGGFPTSSLLLF